MLEILWLATRSLRRTPGRAGLTILGLAIGVAAFIAVVSFGVGARASVVSQFERLGVNMLTIRRAGARPGERAASLLTPKDVRALLEDTTTVELAVPLRGTDTLLSFEAEQHVTRLRASSPDFFVIHDWHFESGGPFDAVDVKQRSKVCVLGQGPARVLFGRRPALGQVIAIHGKMSCRVVGVLAPKGIATSGRDLDEIMVMPLSSFFTHLEPMTPHYQQIDVRPQPSASRGAVKADIRAALRRAHELASSEADDFTLRSPDDAIAVADSVATILTRLLAGIAGVSLLVGGIGIMNIQLVAVAERTQEIGILSAIGASPRQIMTQFLAEAMMLSAVGTGIGSILGAGISVGVAQAMRWPSAVPASAVIGAVVFGAVVGVLFGYLPAQRAATLDPIAALRRE